MQVKLKVFRYNPEQDKKPKYQTFELEAEPTDRVLDLLEYVKNYVDGTLSFRRSCAHGVCGSDAMRINGVNKLACKVLVQDLHTTKIRVEPILGLPVIKDLIVDMEPFMEHFRSVMPFFVNDEKPPARERHQTQAERARFDDTTKCILCAACTTACPSAWGHDSFLGPAAIVQAHRFIFDTRDHATAERLARLTGRSGVWACRTVYNCTMACPREIQVTQAIAEVKRAALLGGP